MGKIKAFRGKSRNFGQGLVSKSKRIAAKVMLPNRNPGQAYPSNHRANKKCKDYDQSSLSSSTYYLLN